jgi:hypothetical protein
MSIAELKETADKLTAEERAWLTRYLATLNRVNDPAFIAEVTRRSREMIDGNFVTRDNILAADSKLRAAGR